MIAPTAAEPMLIRERRVESVRPQAHLVTACSVFVPRTSGCGRRSGESGASAPATVMRWKDPQAVTS